MNSFMKNSLNSFHGTLANILYSEREENANELPQKWNPALAVTYFLINTENTNETGTLRCCLTAFSFLLILLGYVPYLAQPTL